MKTQSIIQFSLALALLWLATEHLARPWVVAGPSMAPALEPGDRLYVIQSGEIELTREGASGHRVVAHLGPSVDGQVQVHFVE